MLASAGIRWLVDATVLSCLRARLARMLRRLGAMIAPRSVAPRDGDGFSDDLCVKLVSLHAAPMFRYVGGDGRLHTVCWGPAGGRAEA